MALHAFLSALKPASALTSAERGRLSAALDRCIEVGRVWSDGVDAPDEAVAAVLGEIVAEQSTAAANVDAVVTALESIPVAEVVLAVACARGNDRALAQFEQHYMQSISAVARRVGGPTVDPGDVRSRVAEQLLVAADGRRARVLDLVGRGSLAGLVRVIAVRTTLNLCRGERREVSDPEAALAAAIAAQTDPELAAIKQDHRAAIKASLHAAIGALPVDERNLLRLSLLHRLSIDEIATIKQVHRATVARRLAKIRDDLGKETRRGLRTQLGATGPDLEHVFGLVASSLDISFERLLATGVPRERVD